MPLKHAHAGRGVSKPALMHALVAWREPLRKHQWMEAKLGRIWPWHSAAMFLTSCRSCRYTLYASAPCSRLRHLGYTGGSRLTGSEARGALHISRLQAFFFLFTLLRRSHFGVDFFRAAAERRGRTDRVRSAASFTQSKLLS